MSAKQPIFIFINSCCLFVFFVGFGVRIMHPLAYTEKILSGEIGSWKLGHRTLQCSAVIVLCTEVFIWVRECWFVPLSAAATWRPICPNEQGVFMNTVSVHVVMDVIRVIFLWLARTLVVLASQLAFSLVRSCVHCHTYIHTCLGATTSPSPRLKVRRWTVSAGQALFDMVAHLRLT